MTQMIGRGSRIAAQKNEFLVIDVMDQTNRCEGIIRATDCIIHEQRRNTSRTTSRSEGQTFGAANSKFPFSRLTTGELSGLLFADNLRFSVELPLRCENDHSTNLVADSLRRKLGDDWCVNSGRGIRLLSKPMAALPLLR